MTLHNLKKFMADRITIYRETHEPDKFGGQSTDEEKIASAVPARLYHTSGSRRVEIEGKIFIPVKKIVVEAETDLRVGDRVETPIESYRVVKVDLWRDEKNASHRTAELVTMEQ